MRKFVAKIEFSADDMESNRIYNRILEAIEDAFPEFIFDDFFRAVHLPDEEITEEDIEAETEFGEWQAALLHSGEATL